jgi:hypothetical protein
MLSSILNSNQAIQVNIQIIRIFSKMRELIASNKEILQKLEELDKRGLDQEGKITLIFEYLKKLKTAKQREILQRNRPMIGFKTLKDN